MSDLTDAQFAAYVDRILECRKAEDTAKEDTKQAYADLKDAGGDKTEAGLLVRALRLDEKDAGKAQAREEMLEEARLRYRRGKASHVRAREASQSYAEAKGREATTPKASNPKASNPETGDLPTTPSELTDTQEQPETVDETHERPSINAEAYPEAGPQAEASPAGIGTGTLAGHEGRSEGEAASAGLPTNSPSPAPQATADDEAAQANPTSSAPLSNPQPILLPGNADSPASTSSPEPGPLSEADVPAFLKQEQRKTSADYRPHCKHPDNCGSSNPTGYCYQCRRAMEAASETEAAA